MPFIISFMRQGDWRPTTIEMSFELIPWAVRIQGAWRLLILDVFTPFSYLCIICFASRQHCWDFVKYSMMGYFGKFYVYHYFEINLNATF